MGGVLNIGVKAEKKRSALDFILGTPPAAAAAKELTEYTVRIEQRSGTGAIGGKKRKNELMNLPTWSSAWTFT